MVSCTGYTALVAEGQSFPDFFKKSCQAFLICYRDCNSDYPIDEAIKESRANLLKRVEELKKEHKDAIANLDNLKSSTVLVRKKFKEYVDSCSEDSLLEKKNKQEVELFKGMLSTVKAYKFSPVLENVKKFMIEQLEMTTGRSSVPLIPRPIMSFEEYKKFVIERAVCSVNRSKERMDEYENYESRLAFYDAMLEEVKRVEKFGSGKVKKGKTK
jgi:hypothetical protein